MKNRPTPSDNVLKAAVEIEQMMDFDQKTATQSERDISRVSSLIESHCHVTEMEAVVEKCRIFIKQSVCHLPWAMPTSIARKERNNWFKRKKEALSSIDALKGDRK